MINLFVANEIGQKSFNDSKIVSDVWENDGWATFTAPEIGDICLSVPNSVNKVCLDAGSSCKAGDSKCEEAFKRYVEALKKGYKKDFASFQKESKTLGYLNTAVGIVGGFFGTREDSPEITPNETTPEQKKKSSRNLAIGITASVLVIGTIVTILVIRNRKNK